MDYNSDLPYWWWVELYYTHCTQEFLRGYLQVERGPYTYPCYQP